MKETLKLFAKSLISNNSCIDGARKKPWYAAIIIFLLGIILSVIPSSVIALKNSAEQNFDSTTYGLREASYEFAKYIKETEDGVFYVKKEGKTSTLRGDESISFVSSNYFAFSFVFNDHVTKKIEQYQEASCSYVIFTEDTVYITVLNQNNMDWSKPVTYFTCTNAYKKVGKDDLKNFLVSDGTLTENVEKTWQNFKGLIRTMYTHKRLTNAGSSLLTSTIVNITITLIMGFMVWILTRGKNNPYHLFTVWQCFATSFWASFTPGLLTVGLGFLLKNFASMMFPLLMGVRVMWLTMKSLRPDGSGYAAN